MDGLDPNLIIEAGKFGTRLNNADKRPGKVVPKQTRRTKAEMQLAREQEAAAKAAKAAEKQKGIDRIAQMENTMAVDDSEAVAAPPQRSRPRPLRRTSSHAVIPLVLDSNESKKRTRSRPMISHKEREGDEDANTEVSEQSTVEPQPKKKQKMTAVQAAELARQTQLQTKVRAAHTVLILS